MNYLVASYDPWVVAASVLIASFASYVSPDLARRIGTHERHAARA